MALFSNYKTALKAEFIKLKGTGTFYICIALGILIPLVTFIAILYSPQRLAVPVNIPYNFYEKLIAESLGGFVRFFFPLLIILIAARITHIDHKNGGWELMETQPLSKASIYLSKLIILLLGNVVAIFSFFLFIVLFYWILPLVQPLQENVATNIPFAYMLPLMVRIFVASLFISIIQLALSIIFKHFMVPVLIGFLGLLGTLFLHGFDINKVWNPFTILNLTSAYDKGSDVGYFFLYTEKIGFIGFIAVAVIAFIYYRNKTFRRTFLKTENLTKVLVASIIALILIVLLVNPKRYKKYDKTVIAGMVNSDQQVEQILLFDDLTHDTLANIPVKNNRFHKALYKNFPLSQYSILVKGTTQYHTYLVFSTDDSVYLHIQFFNNEGRTKVTGTRLAENKDIAKGIITGYVRYLVNDNNYLNKPKFVSEKFYKAWKKDYEKTEKFRTRDNYAPQSDFIKRRKKIISIYYLNLWNQFADKEKILNPDFAKNIPSGILEIKETLTLDDNSLIGNENYLDYVMHELRKADTSDTDRTTKTLKAIQKLKSSTFKDRLLFSVLKKSLKDASDKNERKKYISIYGDGIKDPELHRLAIDYFHTLEQLAKGSPAVDFVAQNLQGKEVRLSDLKGKFVIIDVWATWCGPCQRESPYFEKTAIKNKANDNIVFVALSIDLNRDNWFFQAKNKSKSVMQLHLSKEQLKKFQHNYDLEIIPRYIFLDPDGCFIDARMIRPSQSQFGLFIADAIAQGNL